MRAMCMLCVVMMGAIGGGLGCNQILGWEVPKEGEPLSCEDLENVCGSNGDKDCCAYEMVPAFEIDGGANVAGIYLDVYEVTVGRFKAFLPEANFAGCDATFKKGDERPINCVTWEEARAFCEWDNGRLPTLCELRRAAKADDNRTFPWGEAAPTPEHATFESNDARDVGAAKSGVGVFGQFDLQGNVAEWVRLNNECTGPEVTSGSQRVFGADYTKPALNLVTDNSVESQDPQERRKETGFRCARTP
jgi:formylglycine-generating enzyme required for sulfatase activity